MKKLLFITIVDLTQKSCLGVAKKIEGELKAFSKLGYESWLLCMYDRRAILLHDGQKRLLTITPKKGFLEETYLLGSASEICRQEHIDIVYLRYPLCDLRVYRMLTEIRPIVQKIIIEIPSFPYDEEIKHEHNLIAKITYLQDIFFRKKLKNYVDFICTFGKFRKERIWDIPAYFISNGLDPKDYAEIQHRKHAGIRMISVANIMYHHRYDKVIRGVCDYYKRPHKNTIFVDFVGDGPERKNLEKLTHELNLEEYIIFHGIKYGKDLEKIYETADIGLGDFYFNNIQNTSPAYSTVLKSGEYCAYGLPHALSLIPSAYDNRCKDFFYYSPTDDEKTDIEGIINFYLNLDIVNVRHKMIQFIHDELTWENQLRKLPIN